MAWDKHHAVQIKAVASPVNQWPLLIQYKVFTWASFQYKHPYGITERNKYTCALSIGYTARNSMESMLFLAVYPMESAMDIPGICIARLQSVNGSRHVEIKHGQRVIMFHIYVVLRGNAINLSFSCSNYPIVILAWLKHGTCTFRTDSYFDIIHRKATEQAINM